MLVILMLTAPSLVNLLQAVVVGGAWSLWFIDTEFLNEREYICIYSYIYTFVWLTLTPNPFPHTLWEHDNEQNMKQNIKAAVGSLFWLSLW